MGSIKSVRLSIVDLTSLQTGKKLVDGLSHADKLKLHVEGMLTAAYTAAR